MIKQNNSLLDQLIDEAIQADSTELYLNYLGIKELPKKIFKLTKLTNLTLSGNEIEYLPEEISKLTKLEILDLAGNKLVALPESISQLTQLTHLDLAFNQLSQLPASLSNLTNLAYLDCSSNQLSKLPDSLAKCTYLKTLLLSENNVAEMPENTGRLHRLRVLNLEKNNLKSLPSSFEKLKRLTELHLNGNLLDISFHDIASLTDQPATLIKHFLEVKHQQQEKIHQDTQKAQCQYTHSENVKAWVHAQQAVIMDFAWSEDIEIHLPTTTPSSLPNIIATLNAFSRRVSIVTYLTTYWNKPEHQASFELVNALAHAHKDINNDKYIEELVSTLPSTETDQVCNLIQHQPLTETFNGSIELRISTSNKLKHRILAIYFSLCEMMKKDTYKNLSRDPQVICDAIIQQIDTILYSEQKLEKAKNRIAKGIMLLASVA